MAREFSKPFYRSKEWAMTREYILKRDCYLCQICGAPAEEVHHKIHLSPSNMGDISVTMNPENLVSLCKMCHFNQHKQDKASGIRRKAEENQAPYEYEFDENGYLVRKGSPPGG